MLFRKFRQILYNKSNWNYNLHHFLISTRISKKCVSIDSFWALYRSDIRGMSSLRFVLKESSVMRLWSAWRRNYFIHTVVKRCRRDRCVRDVLQRFRHTLLRPRQTLLLSATAAYKSHKDGSGMPPSCKNDITDEEMQDLQKELEKVKELSQKTLFCARCGKRLVIDRKLPGISYCSCKEPEASGDDEGWEPYMEADEVIVWRKQYKRGQPHYAYKVYGRYKELRAQDFAAVQVDGSYRRVWDSAVASLSVVEREANGIEDQTVLHWEVLWPRLFANRDYVYIRRHKELDIVSPQNSSELTPDPTRPAVTPDPTRPTVTPDQPKVTEHTRPKVTPEHSRPIAKPILSRPTMTPDPQRPSVHSHAKRKSMEKEQMEGLRSPEVVPDHSRATVHAKKNLEKENIKKDDNKQVEENVPPIDKVYIIASRSCKHAKVPVTKHAIRVLEFWSHMVIKSLDGADKPGMEFVLTYYEEPAVGGLPSGVTTWVSGRAAPAFLDRQRRAAADYRGWRARRTHQDLPDYIAFSPETEASLDAGAKATISEQDMESSKQGPDLETDLKTQDRSTQTDSEPRTIIGKVEAQDSGIATDNVIIVNKDQSSSESENKSPDGNEKSDTGTKDIAKVLEKCDENIKSSCVTNANDLDEKNEKESLKSEQKTLKGEKNETNNVIIVQRSVNNETKDGEEKTKSGNATQNGGQEKQNGGGKSEEKEVDSDQESSNSRWWRYLLYPFYYFA